ncbi:zinc ribbon domain-containing protein [Sphingomonas sp. Y38-1Y]|uniref:zinc ribbon domain-containing protein n=1 Tax=Sphingomonas sp. Y38-1Y TaxID=3078265 RepID=UPI0028E39AD7|nr:zinc ribbon domain-containing protein [Sphingomonas sp. Y38-1Y]
MAFCTHCGAQLPADARFCPDCGKPAGAPADTAPAPPPVSPAPPAPPIAEPRPSPDPGPTPMGMQREAQQRRRGGSGGGGGLILPIMVVVALFVIGIMLWSQRDGTRPIAGTDTEEAQGKASGEATARNTGDDDAATAPEARTVDLDSPDDATRTTVISLDRAFRDDPQGARARYAGPVTVSGTVAAPTPGAAPSISLEGRMPFNYVVANLRDPSGFAGAARGSAVTLTCSGVTAIAGTTILQGCALD